MQTMPIRGVQVNVRLNEQEADRAAIVAAHYELSIPGVIRMLLKREAETLGNEAKARKPKSGRHGA